MIEIVDPTRDNPMKKIFAIFCAIILMPTLNCHAWVGGPFSNNSFFGENGDDGVYEASASGVNGIGLFRFVVGNDFQGSQDISTAPTTVIIRDFFGNIVGQFTTLGINSGNTVIGGFGTTSNVWFVRGVSYSGSTQGSVNSVSGRVIGVANAGDSTNSLLLSSGFKANLQNTGRSLPVSSFVGSGRGTINGGAGVTPIRFRFTVLGSKVSSSILFGI